MDAKAFLAEFGHIASAPGGVQRLREMILSLAYQGNLCPHSDQNAEALLASIDEQRTRLDRGDRARKKLDSDLAVIPFRIPGHWRWLSFGEIGHSWGQKTPVDDFTYIDVSSIDNQRGNLNPSPNVVAASIAPSRARKVVRKGDVIYSTVRPYLLNVAIIDRDFDCEPIASTAFAVLHPWDGVLPSFVFHYLRSPHFVAYVESVQIGMAYPAISDEKFFAGMMPVPPTEEQKRIVVKVDDLMTLCDKLEAQQQARETLRLKTRGAVLNALAKAKDSSSLRRAWLRASNSWGNLLDDEQGQGFLHDAVTALAVRGLVSGWGREKPRIGEIKADCSKLKHRYVGDHWLRKQKPIGMAQSASALYPPHWAVVPFDEVAVVIGGVTKGRNLKGRETRFLPYLRVANVQRSRFDLREMKQIEIPVEEVDKYRVDIGDLLITEGGDWDKVGRTAIWEGGISDCVHQNHVFKARIPSALLMAEWAELVFNSAIGREYFAGASKQTTNLASINMSQLRSFPFPVPPLSEQTEILVKVKALTATCSVLKERWTNAKQVARDLAAASVMSITGIRIEDKEEMKAPKTELVSRLRLGISPADKDQAPLAAILIRNNGELAAKALWQASGLEIDDFYRQLKTEMARGWIVEPEPAYVREVTAS